MAIAGAQTRFLPISKCSASPCVRFWSTSVGTAHMRSRSRHFARATEARFARKWILLCNTSSLRSQAGAPMQHMLASLAWRPSNATYTRYARTGCFPTQQLLASLAGGLQSLNPSISQSLNPSIPQSLNPSILQSLNLSISQPLALSLSHTPISQSPNLSISQSLNPSIS